MAVARRPATRGAQLRLLIGTIRRLSAGWCQVERLGEALGINRRTAYRLVLALRRADLPMEIERHGREVHYRLAERWWESLPPKPAKRRRAAP